MRFYASYSRGADTIKHTYRASGVDIAALDKSRDVIGRMVRSTYKFSSEAIVTGTDGHYAGIVKSRRAGAIATHTDGVGTKLLIASALSRYDTVGIDCIAMNANDIVCVGAIPISFVDYIAASRNDTAIFKSIMSGLVKGAKEARVPIVGGETAVVPDLLRKSAFSFDLAGTIVGLIPPSRTVLGRSIRPRDVIIGAHSSGLHSNGYTLARRVLAGYSLKERVPKVGRLGDALLRPTRIYVTPILEILKKCNIHGLAHITGGGFANLLRLKRAHYEIDSLPRTPPIMKLIGDCGVAEPEMYRTFNMGVGMCIIAPDSESAQIIATMRRHGTPARVIGYIGRGSSVRVNSVDVAGPQ